MDDVRCAKLGEVIGDHIVPRLMAIKQFALVGLVDRNGLVGCAKKQESVSAVELQDQVIRFQAKATLGSREGLDSLARNERMP